MSKPFLVIMMTLKMKLRKSGIVHADRRLDGAGGEEIAVGSDAMEEMMK